MLTPLGQEVENLSLQGARQQIPALRQASLVDLREISAFSFALAIGLLMLVAVLRGRFTLALVVVAIVGTSVAIAEVAKRLLVRPELVDAPAGWLANSFPSGHVTMAVAIGVSAILVFPYALRWFATLGGAAFAIAIGQAVETAGWHRLSGVVGATFLVLAVAAVGMALLARSGSVRPLEGRRIIGALTATVVLGAAAMISGGAGVVFGLGRLLLIPVRPTPSESYLAYAGTLFISAGVIALAFLAFLWLVRPFAIDEPVTRPYAETGGDG